MVSRIADDRAGQRSSKRLPDGLIVTAFAVLWCALMGYFLYGLFAH